MEKLIVILDDEPDIVKIVSESLKNFGFNVEGFYDAKTFYQFIKDKKPSLILLDLMLPDEDGFEICKNLKTKSDYSDIPIIILSAKSAETDKVVGLELGADDYITKPFSTRELVARVKTVLKRSVENKGTKIIKIKDDFLIDLDKYEVTVDGEKIKLTTTEFKILKLLTSKIGVVFSREEILDYLWGEEKYVIDRTVDIHIRHLRQKLKSASGVIKSFRGIGYKVEL
ncbi:MAG: response regulator transcription factor [Deltaproteobacteria bacterium]|uniref:Response regulator transcription factor n=1 Tax=Candidatus Zymogenus saltonus TaxID=2844893 RepID=A0A9D8KCX4_9DELT|nr:response regulator transcription factor [Candidatus Zymogenus saltonus]